MRNTYHYLLQIVASLVLIFLAIFIASNFDLYDRFKYLDKTSHFSGGVIVAWFFSIYFKRALKFFSGFERIVILVSCVCLIGVFWEFAEYLSRVYSPEYAPELYRYFRIGSMADTLGDLAVDMMGGILFGLFYILKNPR